MVLTSQDERAVLPLLAPTIHQLNPDVGVEDASTMTQLIDEWQSAYLHRSTANLVGGFAIVALLLGVVGLYGVIASSVSQRTRAIGLGRALRADGVRVRGWVLGAA